MGCDLHSLTPLHHTWHTVVAIVSVCICYVWCDIVSCTFVTTKVTTRVKGCNTNYSVSLVPRPLHFKLFNAAWENVEKQGEDWGQGYHSVVGYSPSLIQFINNFLATCTLDQLTEGLMGSNLHNISPFCLTCSANHFPYIHNKSKTLQTWVVGTHLTMETISSLDWSLCARSFSPVSSRSQPWPSLSSSTALGMECSVEESLLLLV